MTLFDLSVWEPWRLLGAFANLAGVIAVGEWLQTVGIGATTSRRFVHSVVGLFVVVTPFVFARPLPVYALALVFVIVNAVARSSGWWEGIHGARSESWGTVALPLALLFVLLITWSVGEDRLFALQAAFLVLAIADPLASIVGQRLGRRRWVGDATLRGSGAFFGAALLLTFLVLLGASDGSLLRHLGTALIVATVAAAIEAVARRGWDNLFVVLGVVLALVPLHTGRTSLGLLAIALVLAGVFAGAAAWNRLLDGPGAVGGGLFAASLVALGGWAWTIPALVFFGFSSMLSKLPAARSSSHHASTEGERRTLSQVLANGGIAWFLLATTAVLPSSSPELRSTCYIGFLGALAAAAADTWATELGTRWAARPWSLRTLSRVSSGTSGAMSWIGTGAAVLGAATVAVAATVGDSPAFNHSWTTIGSVVIAGIGGMIVDSIAGATVEARYRDPSTGAIVDRRVEGATPIRGWMGVDNDVVNLMATATGAVLAIVLTRW